MRALRERSGGRLQPGRTGFEGRETSGRADAPLRRPPARRDLEAIYRALIEAHGPQQWWPAASADPEEQRLEICLGAILTQNTSWKGAAAAILDLPHDVLAGLVRPSGHFNVKARKLQSFCEAVIVEGGGSLDALLEGEADEVRERLLGIWGIGPETADAMTLYAARKPTFVVDAYAYRLFERLGKPIGPRRYDVYREFLLRAIGPDVWRLNEWHALIVRHGQSVCRRSAPRCEECPLLRRCDFGRAEVGR
jgi:endonuclease-3 related protein